VNKEHVLKLHAYNNILYACQWYTAPKVTHGVLMSFIVDINSLHSCGLDELPMSLRLSETRLSAP
jgi:hypothetical protein